MHVKIKIGYHGLSLIVITPDKTISSYIYIKYNSIYLMSVLKTYVIEVQAGNLI